MKNYDHPIKKRVDMFQMVNGNGETLSMAVSNEEVAVVP